MLLFVSPPDHLKGKKRLLELRMKLERNQGIDAKLKIEAATQGNVSTCARTSTETLGRTKEKALNDVNFMGRWRWAKSLL